MKVKAFVTEIQQEIATKHFIGGKTIGERGPVSVRCKVVPTENKTLDGLIEIENTVQVRLLPDELKLLEQFFATVGERVTKTMNGE